MDDLIKRSDVIDIVHKDADGYDYLETPTDNLVAKIKNLPSVQPRIIRCMGCKYYMQTDTLHHRGWCRWWNHFTAIERYCSEGIER